MTTAITNANIYVERGSFAKAMLIEDGIISAVGTDEDILARASGNYEHIDAQGRTIIPGINDSHLHLHGVGESLRVIMLGEAKSMDELVQIGRKFIADNHVPAGTVVLGRGWNQDYFTDTNRMPTRLDIDKISTEHAIILTRTCGHMLVCNSRALEMAGITSATAQPEGGRFYTDENGNPNGIFSELANMMIRNIVPPVTFEDNKLNIRTAMNYAISHGITSIQTNDVHDENYHNMLRAYREVVDEGNAVRVNHQCCFEKPEVFDEFLAEGYTTGVGDDMSKIGPLKMFADGSLGARTALMRAPYSDDAETSGIAAITPDRLSSMVEKAASHNMQVAVHAIGDGAIEMVLNSYAHVIKDGKNPLRLGVVHCQITDEALVHRFVENDILALVQPIFIHYDMHIVADRVGEKLASTSYAFGTMGRLGVHVSYGTDSPVEDLNTMDNIFCAVTRQDLHGSHEVYLPEECVDIYTAVDNYTVGSAYASFDENKKGRLQPGYFADLAILDKNIFEIPASEIRSVQVMNTMVGGNMVFTR